MILTPVCLSLTCRMRFPDFVGMNLLGYDAMALGNHEFDNTLDVLEMQSELADFPMLAANILYQRWRHSY
ncbi:hypothetical protein O9929_03800 [Vibrio lentus]|nr:hypothetical protein [Vibrio lentus]